MDKRIKIYEINDKYCFTVNKFSSRNHSKLTSFVKPDYKYAWEAYDDAKKIASKHAYHLERLEIFAMQDLTKTVVEETSSETMLGDHYTVVYDQLSDTANGMEEGDKLQKKVNYLEAKAVLTELLFLVDTIPEDEVGLDEDKEEAEVKVNGIIEKVKKLIHKYYSKDLAEDKKKSDEEPDPMEMGMEGGMEGMEGGMEGMGMEGMGMEGGMPPMDGGMGMPMASSRSLIKTAQTIDKDCSCELLEEYGRRACKALEGKHPDLIFSTSDSGVDLKVGQDTLISIVVGSDLFVEDIQPRKTVSELCPYQSLEFYQAYWKPIVEKIGHCCVGNNDSILITEGKSLPDLPKDFPFESGEFQALNKTSKGVKPCCVSFRGNKPSWFVEPFRVSKTASSKYTKEDYYKNGKGAIVVCTDPTLQSYYKNTGHVIQVVPFGDNVEVDIDFGNHMCRMTEDQFEIIDAL